MHRDPLLQFFKPVQDDVDFAGIVRCRWSSALTGGFTIRNRLPLGGSPYWYGFCLLMASQPCRSFTDNVIDMDISISILRAFEKPSGRLSGANACWARSYV